MPAVVELSDGNEGIAGWNYDAIGIDRRFADRTYASFYRAVTEGRGVRNLLNLDEGVNWALRIPAESECLPDLQQMTGLVNNVAGDLILCDFSARLTFGEREEARQLAGLKRLLQEMTLVLFVADPLPSRLLGGHRRLSMIKEMETRGGHVLYVINMYGRGVNKRELYNYLRPGGRVVIGRAPAEEICEAEYNCKNPFQMPGVKRETTAAIEKVLACCGDEWAAR
jgi:hypothetical protein